MDQITKRDTAKWSRRMALAALVVALVCLAMIVKLSDDVTLLGKSRVLNPVDARGHAATMLRAVFPAPADRAGGFISRSGGYDVPPGRIYYAYRESPDPLVPNQFFPIDPTLWPSFVVGLVTPDNPAPLRPGMVSVWLDEQGKLVRLRAVPGATKVQPFELSFWQAFLPIKATWMPETDAAHRNLGFAYDKLTSYRGEDRDGAIWTLTVAEHQGQLVAIDCQPTIATANAEFAAGHSPPAGTLLYLLLLMVATFVALRNIWRGFCDHASSIKVAIAVFLLSLGGHLLLAHHQWTASELDIIEISLAMSLYLAFVAWVAYVAVEPFVRRHLPEAFISWGRLLAGRITDPLIARDLLIGIALTAFCMATSHLLFPLLERGALFEGATTGLSESRIIAGVICVWSSFDTALSMLMLVALVIARRFLPVWPARLACILLWTVPFMTPYAPAGIANFGLTIFLTTLSILVLEKYGFLPIVISWLARLLLLGPITADPQRWHFPLSLSLIAILIAGAVYGYWRTPVPRRDSLNALPTPTPSA